MNDFERLRRERNLTQIELAKIANVSQGAISGIERGNKMPKKETRDRLAKALGVTVAKMDQILKEAI